MVAMSPCGQVYVPNSWHMTLRLGNLRSEKVGPPSFESFSSEHCSGHDSGQKCQPAYCCRNKSLQDNGTLCCAASDATRSLLTQSPHLVSLRLSSSCSSTISRTITSRLVTKLEGPRRSRRTMRFNKKYGGEVLSTPADVTASTHDSTLIL